MSPRPPSRLLLLRGLRVIAPPQEIHTRHLDWNTSQVQSYPLEDCEVPSEFPIQIPSRFPPQSRLHSSVICPGGFAQKPPGGQRGASS
jgi:hypothetical protein